MAAHRPIARQRPASSSPAIRRPATVPTGGSSGLSLRSGDMLARRSAVAARDEDDDEEEEEDGLGWPELPPIFQYRSGIARESVGRGVEYILPVDKGRLSMENVYRVDLRAMFQQPYMRVSRLFDDSRLHAVSRLHLRPNTIHTSSRKEVTRLIDSFRPHANDDVQLRRLGASLSAAPREALEHYCNTSPDNRPLFTRERMQTRSKLFLPFQTNPTSATSEARAKAKAILHDLSINVDLLEERAAEKEAEEKEERERKARKEKEETEKVKKEEEKAKETANDAVEAAREASRPPTGGTALTRLRNAGITSFDDFRRVGEKFRPSMPADVRSRFLDDETNAKVWAWLTEPDEMTQFDYFMTMCD